MGVSAVRQEGVLARTHEGEPGLPRGRSGLPLTAVRGAQRERLLRAVREISVRGVTTSVWLPDAAGPADPEFTDVAPDPGVVRVESRGGESVRFALR